MMRPARITPSMTARLLRLKSQSRIEAARAPVQAPVPGRGIPTKSNKAQKIPLSPAAFSNFCPPLCPLLRHQLKKPPMIGFFAPQVRIWRAEKKRRRGGGGSLVTPIRRAGPKGKTISKGKRGGPPPFTKGNKKNKKGKKKFLL